MHRLSFLIFALCASPAVGQAPQESPRPAVKAEAAIVLDNEGAGSTEGLRDWVQGFRSTAMERGIRGDLYDSALSGVTYDAEVVRRDRNQAEFTKTIWDYLDTAASDLRVTNGKAALAKWDAELTAIEGKYGVDKEIVVAIWGLESAYGTFRGDDPVLNAMATLAYDARRAAFFEEQVVAALRILQDGDTTRARLKGSWAGAMGHTQFMPTSFLDHAVDHDGDGRRDIWGDSPVDALASTAAYLKENGWQTGVPWGMEVTLPDGFDVTQAERTTLKLPSEWAALGVARPDGGEIADHGPASILLPGGAQGAAFMVFANFKALESYNTADAYVVGVGHLADRIRGGAPIQHDWPRHLRALSFDERVELQERLTAAGFDTKMIDAKMGPLTVGAVRAFQQSQGITPDGYPSLDVLDRLRAM